ncbi:MAG: peptidoglycan-binding protein [Deltaproteobacteria bacterium]|nr:peptidoglycan-binding protein [Deltaproteobacteria bacterium]
MGERSADVRRTERLLQTLGMNPGRGDGIFDGHTAAAVRRFERRHHLHVDGWVDARDLLAPRRAAGGDDRQARQQMQHLLDVARRGAEGQRPLGRCLREVQNHLDQVTYGKGKVPRLPYARNFAQYLNRDGNAARLGLKRLPITNAYDSPPGAIIVVRAGSPGTRHPAAGDIVAKARGDHLYNDGEMGFAGRGNFPRGTNHVLSVYVPAGDRAR